MNIDTIDKRKNIINDLWTWYPCGVACGAGEMIEETSDLTGSSWSTSGQYLRAGGGCSSLLVRRKSSTDDEYHHQDMVGVFGVLTNATGTIIQNNLSDAFAVPQYVTQNAQILSKQLAVCMIAVAEPDMQAAPNGRGVSFQARALNVNSKKTLQSNICLLPTNYVCMAVCTSYTWGMDNPSFCEAFCYGLHTWGCGGLGETCESLEVAESKALCLELYMYFCVFPPEL